MENLEDGVGIRRIRLETVVAGNLSSSAPMILATSSPMSVLASSRSPAAAGQ
jgi:hypothetical protein